MARSKLRIALVVVGGVGVALAGAYLLMKRFPNAFDRESADAAQIEKLKATKLTETVAKPESGWPQWRGPNRDGRAPAGPFRANWDKKPLRELWSVPCKGGYATCAVVGGKLYTLEYDAASQSERLLCLDAADGTPLWETASPADYKAITGGYAAGPRSTPTVHEGRVYYVGATGQFACVDANPTKGQPAKEHWRHDLAQEFQATIPRWGVACSPLVEGDLVIVQPGGRSGSVAAFDRITGDKVWAAGSNPSGYSSPVAATLAGERVVLAMTGNALLGLRAADGKELFQHPWVTQFDGNIATPIAVDDYVFISSGYGKGCALLHVEKDGGNLTPKVVYFRPGKLMRNHHSSCVHKDGFLYGFDNETLRCIDLRQGTEVWAAGRGPGKGSLILVDKYLVGLTETGTLFLGEANPEDFKLIDKKDGAMKGSDCWAAPVVVDGKLYLRDNSRIVCYDVAE
jgi:outer membrane protein assembly factor BamB